MKKYFLPVLGLAILSLAGCSGGRCGCGGGGYSYAPSAYNVPYQPTMSAGAYQSTFAAPMATAQAPCPCAR